MATIANSCIWRSTNPQSGSESAAGTDKIEFDIGSVPDNTGHVSDTEIHMGRDVSENPKPKSNDPNELQDNGFGTLEYTITGFIENPINSGVAAKIRDWLREDLTDSKFLYGRFGIRMDDNPSFKVTPSTTYGLMLTDFRFTRIGEWQYRAGFVATLRFNGASVGIGT